MCILIVQAEAVLIRQCWQQEVGCGFGAVSQEVTDCITGGTDGGRGGRHGFWDYGESIGAQIRRGGGGMEKKSNCQSATFVPLWLCSSLPSELVPISSYVKIPVYEVFEWAIFVVVFFSTMNN